MLQSLRDRVQGWVAIAIAVVIAVVFTFWGVQNIRSNKKVVAKVNGKDISEEQVKLVYEQKKSLQFSRGSKKGAIPSPSERIQLKKDALSHLIEEQLVLYVGDNLGCQVPFAQLKGIIWAIPIFQVEGVFSPTLYRKVVRSLFYSERAFFDLLKSLLLQKQLEFGIVDSSFLLPYEKEIYRKSLEQRRKFSYLIVPKDRFVHSLQVDSSAVEKYYETSGNEFMTPDQVIIQYVQLSSRQLAATVQLTASEARDYYRENLSLFSSPGRWQVMRVVAPLASFDGSASKAKEKLEKLAPLLQRDNMVKVEAPFQMKNIWVTEKELPGNIIAQLKDLQPGEVTSVFPINRGGFALFKVISMVPAKPLPYKQVEAEVQAKGKRAKITQQFTKLSEQLSDLAYTSPDSLEPIVTELRLQLYTTKPFPKEVQKEGILAHEKVVNMAFSDMVLRENYNSSLIEIAPGEVIVLRVKEYLPGKLLPLDEVSVKIAQKLTARASDQAAAAFAKELSQRLQEGVAIDNLAAQHSLELQQLTGNRADLSNSSLGASMINKIFTLVQPRSGKVVTAVLENEKNYIVVKLDEVVAGTAKGSGKKVVDYSVEKVVKSRGDYDYQRLMGKFRKRAGIKIIRRDEGV